MPRIAGIDLARALAIGGMFVAHLAKDDGGWWWIADGRSSALFALLAGCGLGFMTARAYPDRNAVQGEYRRILLRALYLGILGIGLMFLQTPVAVILSSYAVMFALTVPFLHLRPAALFGWAAGVAAIAPPIVQGIRMGVTGEPARSFEWTPGLSELVTGSYPALSWLAYSLVGLGVVRLPLRRLATQGALLGAGVALGIVGYGGGRWLERLLGGRDGELTYPMSLVSVEPHTDSGFEILGNIGASLVIISLSLILTRWAWQRLYLFPLTAAGSMSLTLYVGHLLYIWALGPDAVWYPASQAPLLWLMGGSLVFATWWKLFFGRGPLERVLTHLSSPRVGA